MTTVSCQKRNGLAPGKWPGKNMNLFRQFYTPQKPVGISGDLKIISCGGSMKHNFFIPSCQIDIFSE